jgi:hypothetical protein
MEETNKEELHTANQDPTAHHRDTEPSARHSPGQPRPLPRQLALVFPNIAPNESLRILCNWCGHRGYGMAPVLQTPPRYPPPAAPPHRAWQPLRYPLGERLPPESTPPIPRRVDPTRLLHGPSPLRQVMSAQAGATTDGGDGLSISPRVQGWLFRWRDILGTGDRMVSLMMDRRRIVIID